MSLLILSGSIRRASFNTQLAREAAAVLADLGLAHTLLNLADYPLPLYDGDLEATAGLPVPAQALRKLFAGHHGFIIANPEYNSSITPLLKNTLDWVSRKDGNTQQYEPYAGKTALLLSASPGGLGGQRSVRHTREILASLGVLVLPQHVSVPFAAQAFTPEGHLADEKLRQALRTQITALSRLTEKLQAE